MQFKDWFFLPKADRRAILLLSVILLMGLVFLWWQSNVKTDNQRQNASVDSVALAFRDSLLDREKKTMSRVYDSNTLVKKQSNSSVNYKSRKKWQRDTLSADKKEWKRPSSWVEKFQHDTVLDVNAVDTLMLKQVPGIGSWRARRIVEFRGHLGGYSRVEQLLEIDGMPDSVLRWFVIHTSPSRILNLNRATLDEMASHPYLTYKQGRVILQHKRLHGPLKSLSQLSLYEEFTQEGLERLEPYVTF